MASNKVLENHMSDEKFLGIFDSDGSVLIIIEKSRAKSNPKFDLQIVYELNQSRVREDVVQEVSKKFGGKVVINKVKATFKARYTLPPGQQIRAFLKDNPPRCPGRLHDYLLSEEIIKLRETSVRPYNDQTLVCLITLAYGNTRNARSLGRKLPLVDWINLINPSNQDLEKGSMIAETILNKVRNQVKKHQNALPTMTFSLEYIRGSFIGDGTLMVSLTWKPSKSNRRRIEPMFAIVNMYPNYCQAFVNTFKMGSVQKCGPNLYRFVVVGAQSCNKLLYVFENSWLPDYKLNQYNIFKEVLRILECKEHFTVDGTEKIVNLVYGIATKGGRKYSKDELITWGIAWLRDNGYVK
jgi:hypothetical protein